MDGFLTNTDFDIQKYLIGAADMACHQELHQMKKKVVATVIFKGLNRANR